MPATRARPKQAATVERAMPTDFANDGKWSIQLQPQSFEFVVGENALSSPLFTDFLEAGSRIELYPIFINGPIHYSIEERDNAIGFDWTGTAANGITHLTDVLSFDFVARHRPESGFEMAMVPCLFVLPCDEPLLRVLGKPGLEEVIEGLGLFRIDAVLDIDTDAVGFLAGVREGDFGEGSDFAPTACTLCTAADLIHAKPHLATGWMNDQPKATFAFDGIRRAGVFQPDRFDRSDIIRKVARWSFRHVVQY